jgi:hypothetical protein
MSFKQIEPFLDPNNSRQKLYPIQHKDLWEYYKLHKSSFWVSSKGSTTSSFLQEKNKKVNKTT